MANSFASLWRSRKFLILLLDTVISLLTFFVGKYASPATTQDLLTIVGILQPIFVVMIHSIALEDAALKSSFVTYEDITETPLEIDQDCTETSV